MIRYIKQSRRDGSGASRCPGLAVTISPDEAWDPRRTSCRGCIPRLPGPLGQAARGDQPPAGLVRRWHRDVDHTDAWEW